MEVDTLHSELTGFCGQNADRCGFSMLLFVVGVAFTGVFFTLGLTIFFLRWVFKQIQVLFGLGAQTTQNHPFFGDSTGDLVMLWAWFRPFRANTVLCSKVANPRKHKTNRYCVFWRFNSWFFGWCCGVFEC